MAQEQEYKLSQRLWAPNALVRRGRAAADRAYVPSEGSALGACLPACLGPSRCAAEAPPTPSESQRDRQFSGASLGERAREGREDGRGGWSPGQARLGRALQQELRQPPSIPLLRLCPPRGPERREEPPRLKAAGGEPPGRAQLRRGPKRSGQHWAGRTQTRVGVLRSSTKP